MCATARPAPCSPSLGSRIFPRLHRLERHKRLDQGLFPREPTHDICSRPPRDMSHPCLSDTSMSPLSTKFHNAKKKDTFAAQEDCNFVIKTGAAGPYLDFCLVNECPVWSGRPRQPKLQAVGQNPAIKVIPESPIRALQVCVAHVHNAFVCGQIGRDAECRAKQDDGRSHQERDLHKSSQK